jgi:Secretion system C-terminal sorting domain
MKTHQPNFKSFLKFMPFTGFLVCIACYFVFIISSEEHKNEYEEKEDDEYLRALEGFDVWTDMRAYPYKQIPGGKFSIAFERFRKDRVVEQKMAGRRSIIAPGSKSTSVNWQPLAPKNFAGRILCLAFHPTDQNIMWAGSASGGLWKTTNGGTGAANGINWINVPTGFNTLGVSAIAIQASNPDIMYVGTGEVYNVPGDYNGRNVRTYRGTYGIGILKSTNGGATWSKTLDFGMSDLKGVSDILIHPSNPSIVFAATTDGVYRTTDAGNNWSLIHSAMLAQDICFKPGDPNILYIGAGNFGSANHGIYKTTNAAGVSPSFAKLGGGLPSVFTGMVRLHISADNSSKVFASVGKAPGTSDPNGLYVSPDEGATWSNVNTTDYINNQGWYAHDVVVDPSNENTVYVAEMDIWRSLNGGATITQRSFWSQWDFTNTTVGATNEGTAATYVHADIHHLYISPFSNTTIFAVSDGGVFKSTNGTASFIGLNGGLQTAQIYSNMAQSATNANFMILGLQDNATFIYTGSPGCRREIGGDGFSAVIDHTDNAFCFGTIYYNTIYRSTNSGNSFSTVLNNSSNAENACFSAPLVMAPSNNDVLYSATHRVKRSVNNGVSWSNVNGGASLVGVNNPVITLAVAPTDANYVLAATVPGGAQRSRLFKSTDGGNSFSEITGSLPNRYYSDIAFDPIDKDRFVVTLAGYGSSHVYITTDGGSSFVNIGQGLPDVPHNAVIFNPLSSQSIIVGNDLGVYVAGGITDGSVTPSWISFNEGFIDATLVSDLAVTGNGLLRAGTHGKGLWERALPSVTLSLILKNWQINCVGDYKKIQWITESEEEVKHFEIEYAANGRDFVRLAIVQAKGTGDNTYSYDDNVTGSTKTTYRLKMVNTDGSFTYSHVVAAGCTVTEKINVYPNPATNTLNITWNVAFANGIMNIKIYSQNGQLAYSANQYMAPGMNTIKVDVSKLAAGVYTLMAEAPGGISLKKQVVKQ